MKKYVLLIIIIQLCCMTSFSQTFKVGDKVEIYNSGGWYKGSIVETGSGSMQGYYSVRYDGYTQLQWMKASNIKLLSNSVKADAAPGPRSGTYIILSYGNPANPLRLGYFTLTNEKYFYYDMGKKLSGQGTFHYNQVEKKVIWMTGPFKEAGWSGSFEIDREGKTHTIRLNSVTIGTNSSDDQ